MQQYGAPAQGTYTLVGADDKDEIISAPGAGKRLHVVRGVVSIYHENLIGSYVYLSNGGATIYWEVYTSTAANLKSYAVDFGDEGIEMDLNTGFYLGCTGHPSARATFVGYVR